MLNTVSNSTYHSLSSFIKDEITRSKKTIERTKITAYWKIGQAISKHLLAQADRAGYGEHLFKRLADDLDTAETILRQAVRFHQTFPIPHTRTELGWNHYRALLTVKDDNKRLEWERRCLVKKLSVRELKKQLAIKKPNPKKPDFKKPTVIQKLIFKRGELNTYSVVAAMEMLHSINPEQAPKGRAEWIDFGFNIIRGLARSQKLDLMISKKPQYTYKSYVERIIDGDTLWSKIDCGVDTFTRQKLRLRGIDCAEINTKEGQKAKCFVESTLKKCKFIIVQTHKSDKYDRYLADIFFLEGATDASVVAREGKLLNQMLLDNGLAQAYK